MILSIAAVSYGIAALMFALLAGLLLTAWRGRLQGALLVVAAAATVLWSVAQGLHLQLGTDWFWVAQLTELVRDAAWFAFLFKLFDPRADAEKRLPGMLRAMAGGAVALLALTTAAVVATRFNDRLGVSFEVVSALNLFGFLALSTLGVVLVHQLYRDTRREHRWAIKFLVFGLVGLFTYDLYLYSHSLLFSRVDPAIWTARGLANAIVVPFIAVSARRNPIWSVEVFVSRQVVFHSTALVVVGVYLMLMAAAGYYIKLYGGSWGGVVQVGFVFLSLLLLVALLVSGKLRSRVKVLLNKHFFKNRYDYREEWLNFTRALSDPGDGRDPREHVVQAFADIVGSDRGVIWARQSSDYFQPVAAHNLPIPDGHSVSQSSALVRFLQQRAWIVDMDEFQRDPSLYAGLVLPDWFTQLRDPWVLVPLMHNDELIGFIVITRPLAPRTLNWEDRDLLKTCGRQAASHLALLRMSEALQDARQFEAFNRLSAFVVHDLKNLVAQLSLVVSNAERHMHSPGFIEDAIATVDNAAGKMNRLLAQLRKDRRSEQRAQSLDLAVILHEVVRARAGMRPAPRLELDGGSIPVVADPDRMEAVVEHLVQNAQDATAADGDVVLTARIGDAHAVLEVRDTGCGMDARFISERLFRPFDTTKGNAGMGVGVYEAREFAQAHGGSLEVDSTPGRGTVFRMILPLDAAAVDTTLQARLEAAG
jgi:putative PEP-CTERM system histidine kinase